MVQMMVVDEQNDSTTFLQLFIPDVLVTELENELEICKTCRSPIHLQEIMTEKTEEKKEEEVKEEDEKDEVKEEEVKEEEVK